MNSRNTSAPYDPARTRLQYRALESTNTRTRRLAYLSALLRILHRESISERTILGRLTKWSQQHRGDLARYWVQAGEVTSLRSNSAGMRYLQLGVRMHCITPIAELYRTTRIGLVLFSLLTIYGQNENPFLLTPAERLFYAHRILDVDSDLLLAVMDAIATQGPVALSQLQRTFRQILLARIDGKIEAASDEAFLRQLGRRRATIANDWKRPQRYAEHLVPPRVNWLLDLGYLEPEPFRAHRYVLTPAAEDLLAALPRIPGTDLHDVSGQWLGSRYWTTMATTTLTGQNAPRHWSALDERERETAIGELLHSAFRTFQYTPIPKISLTPAAMYLCIRLILDHGIATSPDDLRTWFTSSPILNERRYEIRVAPRENESYLLASIMKEDL